MKPAFTAHARGVRRVPVDPLAALAKSLSGFPQHVRDAAKKVAGEHRKALREQPKTSAANPQPRSRDLPGSDPKSPRPRYRIGCPDGDRSPEDVSEDAMKAHQAGTISGTDAARVESALHMAAQPPGDVLAKMYERRS
jgi:hypothetical protein